LLTGAAALGTCLYVGLVTPTATTVPMPCPLHSITGLWCPGCGATRGMHALLTGHPMEALGFNLLLIAIVPLALYGWASWTLTTAGRPVLPHPRVVPAWVWSAAMGLAVTFAVLRNLPVEPFRALAP
jgi:hypothetical protein